MSVPTAAAPRINQSGVALLVDPDVDTRRMYATYLRQAMPEVEEADDGREALAKAISRRPGVIVTETRLPGINGFELCRILRQDESTRAIPIVVVTADADERDIQRARSSGADAVLVKPCLPERLAAEISRTMATSTELRIRALSIQGRLRAQLAKADELLHVSRENFRGRSIASHAFNRVTTVEPPDPPPTLVCPLCDRSLVYLRSHIGGVSARYAEQWDYFECSAGCGAFQYRHRTRKLRRVV